MANEKSVDGTEISVDAIEIYVDANEIFASESHGEWSRLRSD
jgi:hypothetical protein